MRNATIQMPVHMHSKYIQMLVKYCQEFLANQPSPVSIGTHATCWELKVTLYIYSHRVNSCVMSYE